MKLQYLIFLKANTNLLDVEQFFIGKNNLSMLAAGKSLVQSSDAL
jgi:hypothetical protein